MGEAKRLCLVSVVTPGFLPGALAMLFSFFQHNAWFDGDVVVLHKDLTSEDQTKLTTLSPKIRVQRISDEMARMAAKVVGKRPELRSRESSFYKGELLRLDGYDQIIMSDCDIVYTGSVKSAVMSNEGVRACGDGSHYRGEQRSKADYARVAAGSRPILQNTFSAGFVLFSTALFEPEHFSRYLAMMEQYCGSGFPSGNTDQAIFNVLFDGAVCHLDPIYNYHLMHKDLIREKTGRTFSEAIVLHYGGANKPWDPIMSATAAANDPELHQTFQIWRAVYLEYLQRDDPPSGKEAI
jgi:lipopolysaccharide biosynthesis glycosyltransferase